MKLWRVILSLRLKSTGSDGWNHTVPYAYNAHPCTFYVHAVCASDARSMAISLVSAGMSPRDEYRTSGCLVAVDGNLNPVHSASMFGGESAYHSWDDLDALIESL